VLKKKKAINGHGLILPSLAGFSKMIFFLISVTKK